MTAAVETFDPLLDPYVTGLVFDMGRPDEFSTAEVEIGLGSVWMTVGEIVGMAGDDVLLSDDDTGGWILANTCSVDAV